MDAERQQYDPDIGAELYQEAPAEERGQVEHEAGDGDRRQANDQRHQPHRHVENAFDHLLQRIGLWRRCQQQPDPED